MRLMPRRMATVSDSKPTIYVFCNSCSPQWHVAYALAEDGTGLASHVCSDHGWVIHDMGVSGSDWKHDLYNAHYPDGWAIEYVDVDDIPGHAGLQLAIAAAKAKQAAAPEQP